MSIYRTIYEQHYGPIPVDSSNRTYEIHHLDGNRKNNDLSNLLAVSIQEHYDIHYKQGDYAACIRIASRMNMTPEEISKKASEINIQRAKDGKHPFSGGVIQGETSRRRIREGTHNFLNSEEQRKTASKASRKRVKEGTHHFCDPEFSRIRAMKRIEKGIHNFQNQSNVKCPHCDKIGRLGPMTQWHFDNCRYKNG